MREQNSSRKKHRILRMAALLGMLLMLSASWAGSVLADGLFSNAQAAAAVSVRAAKENDGTFRVKLTRKKKKKKKNTQTENSGSGNKETQANQKDQKSGSNAGSAAQDQKNGSNAGSVQQETVTVDEDGAYTSKEEVALYLHLFGHLPDNFITKNEARDLGWVSSEGNLDDVAPGMSIGGDYFGNYEELLPVKKGRKYYECDIDFDGGYRGSKRIIYSNDGLVYYTEDHYQTFEQLYGEE